jgi:hypothetical protein
LSGEETALRLTILNRHPKPPRSIAGNVTDLAQLASAFNALSPSPKWNANADLNGDSRVTIADLGLLADSFGRSGDP